MRAITATIVSFLLVAFVILELWEKFKTPIEVFLKYSYFGEITLILAAIIIIFFLYVLFEMLGWDIDKDKNKQ